MRQKKISATLSIKEFEDINKILIDYNLTSCQFNLRLLRWLLDKPSRIHTIIREINKVTHISEIESKVVENTSITLMVNPNEEDCQGETNVRN